MLPRLLPSIRGVTARLLVCRLPAPLGDTASGIALRGLPKEGCCSAASRRWLMRNNWRSTGPSAPGSELIAGSEGVAKGLLYCLVQLDLHAIRTHTICFASHILIFS